MKRAALGVCMHSGWGALVAISDHAGAVALLDRRRIVATHAGQPGANQPYHFARTMELREAESFLASAAATSERIALAAVREAVDELRSRDYQVTGAAVLLASGRPLPALVKILASHPQLHAAEGEFFRGTFARACERLGLPVTGYRERELEARAKELFGRASPQIQRTIAALASSLGPPWTKDHKRASLAALMTLSALPTKP